MTDLLDQIDADLDAVFFPTGGSAYGFTVDLTPTGGSAIPCIFDDNTVAGDDRAGPRALIRTSDLGAITHGTRVGIDSRSFQVAGRRPQGSGDVLELELEEVT